MNLIQHQTRRIQAVLRADFGRQDLVKSCIAVIHDTLRCRHNLAPLQECRCHLHHLVGDIKDDGCLLAVGGSTIDFGRGFVIGKEQIQSYRSGKFGFAVLLTDFDISRAELTVSSLVHDAEHIPDDLFLPRKQPELFCPPTCLLVCRRFSIKVTARSAFCGIVVAG